MPIYFPYALVLGIVFGITVFIGCLIGSRKLVIAGIVFSSITASPVTSFTRGTAGAIYASDIVGIMLFLGMIFLKMNILWFSITPKWYKSFFWLMIIAIISVIFIAPLVTANLGAAGLTSNVRSPIPGLPLWVLMAGFRTLRVLLLLIYFMYSAHLLMDENTLQYVFRVIAIGVAILALCQIIDFVGIKNMGLYIPWKDWQAAHIVGHPKSSAGRIYLVGIFACLALFYRSWSAPLLLVSLMTMFVAILFSGSRAALVGVLIGFCFFAWRGKLIWKLMVIVVLISIPIGLAITEHFNPERIESLGLITGRPMENARWAIWKWSILNIVQKPYILITGLGFSNFRYAVVGETEIQHGHNDFLTCIVELGIVGFLLFFFYVVDFGREIVRQLKYSFGKDKWIALCMGSVFFAFLATSQFESSIYYSAGSVCMQRIFIVLLGSYTAFLTQREYLGHTEISDYSYDEICY